MFENYLDKVRSVRRDKLFCFLAQDERSGTILYDSSGIHTVTGSYNSVTLNKHINPAGIIAPYYDGINDYSNITNIFYEAGRTYNLVTTKMTLMCWYRIDPDFIPISSDRHGLFEIRFTNSTARVGIYKHGVSSGNAIFCALSKFSDAIGIKTITYADVANNSGWHCLVASFADYSTLEKRFKFWTNGVLRGETAHVSTEVETAGVVYTGRIGYSQQSARYSMGNINCIACWSDVELSNAEADYLYRGAFGG